MIPKFRAFHKKEKKMKEVYEITFHKDSTIVTVLTGEYTGFTPILMALRVPEDAELLQSTGLKDKNGKEISEGDIVRVSNVYNAEIVFHDGCFCVHDKEKGNYYEFTVLNLHDLEVIGNVCKNAELLKGNGE